MNRASDSLARDQASGSSALDQAMDSSVPGRDVYQAPEEYQMSEGCQVPVPSCS